MPYTFAHPGFALFLKKKYLPFLSLNGLVFGSLAPDIDLMVRLTDVRFHLFDYGIVEVFFIILPISILMCFAFHLVSRQSIIDHLPSGLKQRFEEFRYYSFTQDLKANFPAILLSFITGIYLHLLLDYFTHWNAHHVMMFFHVMFYPIKAIMPITYYGSWYLPFIIFSILGFWLTVEYSVMEWSDIKKILRQLNGRIIFFWSVFLMVAVLVMFAKSLMMGMGTQLAFHYFSIHFTSGILISLFLTPALFRPSAPFSNHD